MASAEASPAPSAAASVSLPAATPVPEEDKKSTGGSMFGSLKLGKKSTEPPADKKDKEDKDGKGKGKGGDEGDGPVVKVPRKKKEKRNRDDLQMDKEIDFQVIVWLIIETNQPVYFLTFITA